MNPKDVNKAGSDFIRDRMERTRLNQTELAKRTGVSQERISRIVNDESRISLHDFVILSSVLDPDFTRDFLKKVGLEDILCKPSNRKIYANPMPNAMVSNMLKSLEDDSSSHPFLQALIRDQEGGAFKSTQACNFDECLPDLRQPIRVWTAFTVAAHCNTGSQIFAMQRELAQNISAERLC